MASITQHLAEKGLITFPRWVPDNVHYECMMGSVAYGASNDTSDMDVYGWCFPPKSMVFPHLAGEIYGFGKQIQRFEVAQQHHIIDKDAMGGKGREVDLSIYSIVKYAQLCMENNPNMIDSLFVPRDCILHVTPTGQIMLDQRRDFLHKGAWPKFKGYAYSQMHKIRTKEDLNDPNRNVKGTRKDLIEQYGFDVKFAYHVVRLINEVEQILVERDIDLRRHGEQLKAIRRGEWTLDDIKKWFSSKENDLDKVYHTSTIPYGPDEAKIRGILIACLKAHYGDLHDAVIDSDAATRALRDISVIADRILSGVGGKIVAEDRAND